MLSHSVSVCLTPAVWCVQSELSAAIKDNSNELKKSIKVKMDALSKVNKKTKGSEKSKSRAANEPDAVSMVLRALQGGLPFTA